MNDLISLTEDRNTTVMTNKEEMPSRIKSDNIDRKKLRQKLQISIDPFDTTSHPDGIVHVVNGLIAPKSVNVDQSVTIGEQLRKDFEASWPLGFYNTIPRKVSTMSVLKNKITVEKTSVYDTEMIYSRVIGLQASRDICMKNVLAYELAPVPTALFEDSGNMDIPKG